MDRVETLEENMTKLYLLVWGQYTDALKAEPERPIPFERQG